MANIVALLDSMWGWGGYNTPGEEAPAHFRINPENHSGRRLYSLVGSHNLIVTNCCRMVQSHANAHGKPDFDWMRKNLKELSYDGMDLLLVCGRVAQKAFDEITYKSFLLSFGHEKGTFRLSNSPMRDCYLMIDHPAARRWSKASIESTAQEIERICRENSISSK